MKIEFILKRIIVILIFVLLSLFPLALYKYGLIDLKDVTGRVGDLAVSAIAIVLGTVIATIIIYYLGVNREKGKRDVGELQISDISVQPNEIKGTCTLDFRVHNSGGSDVQINRVNFKVLDIKEIGILGPQSFSEVYDLDISELKKIDDVSKDFILHQNIEPTKSDRFAIVLTTKNITGYRLWKLEPKLITNFGEVLGQSVEVWLPHILKELSRSSIEEMNMDLEKEELASQQPKFDRESK